MVRHLLSLTLVAVFILPIFASAATIAELQAHIAALTAQIATLQAQGASGGGATRQSSSQHSAGCLNLPRNLSRGSRGSDVAELQRFLISQTLLAADSATGFFGMLTENAVKQWQCQKMSICSGSPNTNGHGVAGARTRAAVASACIVSAAPAAVPTPVVPQVSVVPTGPAGAATPTTQSTSTSCTPLSPQAQTLSCPLGQIGSIAQSRTSVCATGATTPTWNAWSTMSNTCAASTPTAPVVLTKYPNFTNICERRVVDYQNGMNVLSPAPAGCAWPNSPLLLGVTHESALNTHWRLAPDGTKIYDDNFVGDSAVYMHDYRDSDLGVIFRHDFVPLAGENGTHFLGMALDTVNFPGINVTGRDFRDGYLFMGLADISISDPSLSKNIYVDVTFRIRGNDLVSYQGAASAHRLILGTKLTWSETGRTNTAHYFEFNLFKSPGFHAVQTQYACPSDGLTYDYCAYDSSTAGLYAEVKYVPISSIAGYQSLSNITTDTWYTVRVPLSSLVKDSGWFSPPQSWSSAILDGVYLGIESRGASRLWVEIKEYAVTEE